MTRGHVYQKHLAEHLLSLHSVNAPSEISIVNSHGSSSNQIQGLHELNCREALLFVAAGAFVSISCGSTSESTSESGVSGTSGAGIAVATITAQEQEDVLSAVSDPSVWRFVGRCPLGPGPNVARKEAAARISVGGMHVSEGVKETLAGVLSGLRQGPGSLPPPAEAGAEWFFAPSDVRAWQAADAPRRPPKAAQLAGRMARLCDARVIALLEAELAGSRTLIKTCVIDDPEDPVLRGTYKKVHARGYRRVVMGAKAATDVEAHMPIAVYNRTGKAYDARDPQYPCATLSECLDSQWSICVVDDKDPAKQKSIVVDVLPFGCPGAMVNDAHGNTNDLRNNCKAVYMLRRQAQAIEPYVVYVALEDLREDDDVYIAYGNEYWYESHSLACEAATCEPAACSEEGQKKGPPEKATSPPGTELRPRNWAKYDDRFEALLEQHELLVGRLQQLDPSFENLDTKEYRAAYASSTALAGSMSSMSSMSCCLCSAEDADVSGLYTLIEIAMSGFKKMMKGKEGNPVALVALRMRDAFGSWRCNFSFDPSSGCRCSERFDEYARFTIACMLRCVQQMLDHHAAGYYDTRAKPAATRRRLVEDASNALLDAFGDSYASPSRAQGPGSPSRPDSSSSIATLETLAVQRVLDCIWLHDEPLCLSFRSAKQLRGVQHLPEAFHDLPLAAVGDALRDMKTYLCVLLGELLLLQCTSNKRLRAS